MTGDDSTLPPPRPLACRPPCPRTVPRAHSRCALPVEKQTDMGSVESCARMYERLLLPVVGEYGDETGSYEECMSYIKRFQACVEN